MAGRKMPIAIALLAFLACATAVQGQDAIAKASADGSKMEPAYYGGGQKKDSNKFWDTLAPGAFPCPKATKTCACEVDLAFTQDLSNNCNTNGCASGNPGGLCTNTIPGSPNNCFTCVDQESDTWAYCRGTTETGETRSGGGALCYTVTCPEDGTVRITGSAVSLACATAGCGLRNFLYLYRGQFNYQSTNDAIASDQLSLDETVTCTAGQVFSVCELDGIIITDTLTATFTRLYSDSCPIESRDFGCTTCGIV